ncbi:MAG: flagellar biosynthetic protein FliQ [Firmicutes bacterium]|nr:flagellar biosynthetic protein FliQ [Bacillota bacterium]
MTITGPLLGIALVVGLIIGVFQAATQIQEMTLSFLPKAAAMAAVLFFAGPWFLHVLVQFAMTIFQQAGTVHP